MKKEVEKLASKIIISNLISYDNEGISVLKIDGLMDGLCKIHSRIKGDFWLIFMPS